MIQLSMPECCKINATRTYYKCDERNSHFESPDYNWLVGQKKRIIWEALQVIKKKKKKKLLLLNFLKSHWDITTLTLNL